ncbi:hypothetical protein PTL465_06390 [Ligilactobacillus agilis]|nr:hypothetical protein PTL465_06390 [Ligilactobacillus agilis]
MPKELEERFIAKGKVLGLVGSDSNIAYTDNEDIRRTIKVGGNIVKV